MNNYNKALDYLSCAALRGSKLGLERITDLMHRLGDPQNTVRIIHVAGTNGKGSFGAMLSAVLTDAGFSTGWFSSPALTGVTDSFRINGCEVSHDTFGNVMAEIIPVCEIMNDKPTEFEVLTAAAYLLFARQNCRFAVVECGMGGDSDSTNVISAPFLSVITNVQLDHTGFLGSTISEIAEHKSGIIKLHRPVVTGASGIALDVIARKAADLSAELVCADLSRLHTVSADLSGVTLYDNAFGQLTISLLGSYQSQNTAIVLTAVEVMRRYGAFIPDSAVFSGLGKTRWHGRFELLRKDPCVIYDGAHNPDGIRSAADSIRRFFPNSKFVLLIGVMADKEYQLYADTLGPAIFRAFTVRPNNPRALDAASLADTLRLQGVDAVPCDDLSCGVTQAFLCAQNERLPLIALGSLYMYADFVNALDNM